MREPATYTLSRVESDTIERIAADVRSCTKCPLHRGRLHAVPGEGSGIAGVYFLGEGPGHYENQQGRPFVGAAGQLLDELLEGVGLDRKVVWISNVVRCRPPENRDPLPEEIDACEEFTHRQLEVVAPKVVVTLGRHAMSRFLPGETIGKVHGRPRRVGEYIVFPMYHPAAALRQPALRATLAADFSALADLMERTPAAEAPAAPEPARPPAQMDLFGS